MLSGLSVEKCTLIESKKQQVWVKDMGAFATSVHSLKKIEMAAWQAPCSMSEVKPCDCCKWRPGMKGRQKSGTPGDNESEEREIWHQ